MSYTPSSNISVPPTRVRVEKIHLGWWYAICCEEDLEQIGDEATLEWVRDALTEDCGLLAGIWISKKAALHALGKVSKITI